MSHHVLQQLPDWLAGDINATQLTEIRDHLQRCDECRREWNRFDRFTEEAVTLGREADLLMDSINWAAFARDTLKKAHLPKTPIRLVASPFLSWRAAISGIAATVLIVYLAISGLQMRTSHSPLDNTAAITNATLERMESNLTRENLLQYLTQSQIILTDIMKQCRTSPPDPQDIARHSRQIRTLLQKKAFIEPELDRIELAKAEPVCTQLDLLFYQIMEVPPEAHCAELERIQSLIRQENLLFKIRLLESDLRFAASEA